jgi:hypothetical protein
VVGFIRAERNWFTGSFSNDSIIRALRQEGIEVSDMTRPPSTEELDARYYLDKLDRHPSAVANLDRANILVHVLGAARATLSAPDATYR